MKKTGIAVIIIVLIVVLYTGLVWAGFEGSTNTGYGTNTGGLTPDTYGYANCYFGVNSGEVNTGEKNTFIGTSTGTHNTSANQNTFIGYGAGLWHETGGYNTLIGCEAGYDNIAGLDNTFLGHSAGYSNTGSSNVFIGNGAGYHTNFASVSNTLIIDNFEHSGATPLIEGNFTTHQVKLNGMLVFASDGRLKKNIKPLNSSLDKVINLKGVSYEWKEDSGMGKGRGREIGLIAQDVEAVIPELVYTDDKGYKSLSYEKLVPVLVEAIKEQQQTVETQKKTMAQQDAAIKMLTEKLAKLDKLEAEVALLRNRNMTAQK